MPNLLSPTNPVPGYDNVNVKNIHTSPNDPSIRNIVDPSRVVRSDGRTEQQDTGDATSSHALRYESNFLSFLQRLQNSPDLAESVFQLLQDRGIEVSSGISAGLAAEMSNFLEFFSMDEKQLMFFLQSQLKSEARFGGTLFQALRNAYASSQSAVARNEILQFLQRFSDYSSTSHLEGKMLRTLYDISQSLPARWAQQLLNFTAQMENGVAAGDRAGNLEILRQQVFPLVSNYVAQTHDHGRARDLLSMLTLDMIRYENGDEKSMVQAFRRLTGYDIFSSDLSKLSDGDILRLLKETDYFKASQNDLFSDYLSSIAKRALKGEGGIEKQEIFRNIMNSVLINESVFMPLRHVMIPLEWNGRTMFSEMWIDPNADGGKRGQSQSGQQGFRVLIKMDIQNLGAFDLIISTQGETTSINAACPESVAAFSGKISRAISGILERNGLKPGEISIAAMKRPLTISQVFPDIFEGVNGVDVKI